VTGTFGFSYIGLIWLLLLFVPNLLWAKKRPDGYDELAKSENKVLLVFERVGQAAVVCSALVFSDYNPTAFSGWTAWLIASAILMLLYEAAWVRYFISPTLKTFYGRLLFIPVPLASLPVLAFLLLGLYGKVLILIASAVILGVGHIGIHGQHIRRLKRKTTAEEASNA
jgi:hypothetical protein